ncbi:DUF192 domain-containing protein [Pusillimonas sp.]|uniref:DUF192 domain-containing protein n=1 Tax=Pusillimonas sp. TaxID=3040095 RepID=UPI0037C7C7A0
MLKLAPLKRPSGPLFLALPRPAKRAAGSWKQVGNKAKGGVCAALLLASLVPVQTSAQGRLLPTTTLQMNGIAAYVEVAATPEVRNRGLMFRESLPPDHGMLFVFEHDGLQCFWMKNTPLPLTIAFIDAEGLIINLRDMQPHSEAEHCPARPMRYALEMRQGWFGQYGIKAGSVVKGLPAQ